MSLYHRCACVGTGDCVHPWWMKFKYRGAVVRETTEQTSRRKAELVEIRRHAAIIDRGTGLTPATAPRLRAHVQAYLAWAQADHPATAITKDARILPTLVAVVGDKRLDAVTSFDIDRWRSARLKVVSKGRPLSRSTVNRELTIVRGLFQQAIAWQQLIASPVVGIAPWAVDDARVRILTHEERVVVLTRLTPLHAMLCRVTLEALLRLSEVLTLRREDLGPASIQRRLKGGRVTTIPVSQALIADLRGWLRTPAQVHVFGDPPPNPNAVASLMTRDFRANGLRGISHHTMRHTGVTDMLEDGISNRAIQEYAGWTSQRMLERYGHLRDAELQRATIGTAARNTAAMAAREQGAQGGHTAEAVGEQPIGGNSHLTVACPATGAEAVRVRRGGTKRGTP